MRFLRFLCNLLVFIALTIGISVLQIGLYNVTALQSKDIPEIKIAAETESDIAYFDNYTFWVDDISENLEQPAKYRVRNWIALDGWKSGMEWADVAVDTTIAVVKPIVVPVAQVNALNTYYGYDINDFEKYLMLDYETEEELNNALYEVYVIYGMGYGDAMTFGENPVKISEYNYTGIREENTVAEYGRWVNLNHRMYNTIWRLNKYNSETYDKYFKKFIEHDVLINADGSVEYVNRHIKTAVSVMYYQQMVSLIIALIFVIKYPIALGQVRIEGKKYKRKKLESL